MQIGEWLYNKSFLILKRTDSLEKHLIRSGVKISHRKISKNRHQLLRKNENKQNLKAYRMDHTFNQPPFEPNHNETLIFFDSYTSGDNYPRVRKLKKIQCIIVCYLVKHLG